MIHFDREYKNSEFQPLECDECGAVFGWVWDFDLQGSVFMCHGCKVKEPGEPVNPIRPQEDDLTVPLPPKRSTPLLDPILEEGATEIARLWALKYLSKI